ncbi:MAG: glycosyltransferase family 4 protein [Luteolibacter sp.]
MKLFSQARRIAFLGNYVPRQCGIATFTNHLWAAVSGQAGNGQCIVMAVNDRDEEYDYPPEVRHSFNQRDVDAYVAAAHLLNQSGADVLCVQHEFGIYGGAAGGHLVSLLRETRLPVVTTLHTILQQPNEAQRKVVEALVRRSDRLVVMARKGLEILCDVYGAEEAVVEVVAHGIPDMPRSKPEGMKGRLGLDGRTVMLTFGLLGPGKGIEHAIRAMPEIVARHPEVVYLILGATHPHLVEREGETYRTGLEHLARDLGVGGHVMFHNRFVSHEELQEFIVASDIYVTPYLSEAQITSGALAYVFGAGKAVVSTPYWHAAELLSNGRGCLVPFRDPAAIAGAVNGLLDNPDVMAAMSKAAYDFSRSSVWPEVGRRYLEIFERARKERRVLPEPVLSMISQATRPGKLPRINLDHVVRMTDSTGMVQHAIYNVPNYREGYCVDDNARALILCNLLEEAAVPQPRQDPELLATRYLAFLAAAYNPENGRFRNFMAHDRRWLEEQGSEDSHGRTMWAVGHGSRHSLNDGHRRLCSELFERGLAVVADFTSPRAWAFVLLGAGDYLVVHPGHHESGMMVAHLLGRMKRRWSDASRDDWPWFEDHLTYENARFCQVMIRSGGEFLEIGLRALRWLAEKQRSAVGHFRPVGSRGFDAAVGGYAHFDQQPVEAQGMVAACLDAYAVTSDDFWWREARRAFDWFIGRNDLGVPLADYASGGCRDGLHPDRANENQGAESTLAFQIALAELIAAEHRHHHNPPHHHETPASMPS